MATISTCPKCLRMVTVPEGFEPGAAMRCPLCQAEYPLSEALASVPPALVPVGEANAAAASVKIDTGLATAEHFDTAQFTPVVTEESAEEVAAPGPVRRRKRKSKSMFRVAFEVVLAGIVGLLIGYYTVWWIQGEACRLPRIPWLPLLPSAQPADALPPS